MPEESVINIELLELPETRVELENVLVDPNNPRLLEMGFENVPDSRIGEEDVQKEAIGNMKNVGLRDIIEKVKNAGFLKIDRVVVRPLGEKFVVLEGNRRISALNILKEDHIRGRVNLKPEVLSSISSFPVLVYNGTDRDIVWFLQGIRHIKGIKDWGPIQQGKYLTEMQERKNFRPTDLAEMTGLGRNVIANLIRSYNGWKQAKDDDDYGDKVDADKFSLFQEAIFKKDSLKKWLGWNDDNKKFENQENLKKLLRWYLGDDEVNNGQPRLPRVNPDVRDTFSMLLLSENSSIFEKFENEDIEIDEARSTMDENKYKRSAQEVKINLDSQLADLERMIATIRTIPISMIIKNDERIDSFITNLQEIENAAKEQKDIIKTMKDKNP